MKISVLMENTRQIPNFQTEHGLSLYLETGTHCILFDMGQSDKFIQNAKMLGIDLSKVDIAILSHGHYDHGGGLESFLEINQKAKIYLSTHAFNAYFSKERYIGLNKDLINNKNLSNHENLKNHERFIFIEDKLEIEQGLVLYSCNDYERLYDMPNRILKTQTDEGIVLDDFHHELYFLVQEEGKDILISGCSHKGIQNIMHWFNPSVLIGGFHFKDFDLDNEEDRTYLDNAIQNLLSYNTRYYTCHCTGLAQFRYVEKWMKNTIKYISTGEVFYV